MAHSRGPSHAILVLTVGMIDFFFSRIRTRLKPNGVRYVPHMCGGLLSIMILESHTDHPLGHPPDHQQDPPHTRALGQPGGLALVGLPRAEPRRAIAAVGAWLCEGWCHLSAAVPGHRGGCVRHPGATLEGGGRNSRPAGAVSWLLSSCKGFPVSSGPSCMDRTMRLFCMHRDRTVNRGDGLRPASGCSARRPGPISVEPYDCTTVCT